MVDLDKWALVYMPRDEAKAKELESELKNLSIRMGFRIQNSRLYRYFCVYMIVIIVYLIEIIAFWLLFR